MTGAPGDMTILACSIFRKKLEAMEQAGQLPIAVAYLPSLLHMEPTRLEQEVRQHIDSLQQKKRQVVLLFGDCHPSMLDMQKLPGVCRVEGLNCVEIMLGKAKRRELLREGAFILFHEWAVHWKNVFKELLGLQPREVAEVMQESHKKLVYLDTGLAPIPHRHLQECSDFFQLPLEILPVTLSSFQELMLATLKKAAHS
jgi:hypothetical protein